MRPDREDPAIDFARFTGHRFDAFCHSSDSLVGVVLERVAGRKENAQAAAYCRRSAAGLAEFAVVIESGFRSATVLIDDGDDSGGDYE
jgi:hypothetical protein